MNLQNAFGIGLYSYSILSLSGKDFHAYYDLIVSTLDGLELAPTYIALEGEGFKGDLVKVGGRSHVKALKSGFSGVRTLSIVVNPEESVSPGYDSFLSASLSHVDESQETVLSFSAEERLIEFGGKRFKSLLESLIRLHSWDFGFALTQPIDKRPEFHVLGLDNGKLTPEEHRRLADWYSSPQNERVKKIRDVYPVNIINDTQLHGKQLHGKSLSDMILQDPHSSLSKTDDGKLWVWEVESDAIATVRERIRGSGVLIT